MLFGLRMKFSLEVGNNEKHHIQFTFNQLLGKAVLAVDGTEVFRKARWFDEPMVDYYAFEIGQFEPVCLRIEKKRTDTFASKYCVYVDNRLTQLHEGI
jgi:hypothetical protein